MDITDLEPWQQLVLDKMKSFKGRGIVQLTGRRTGKSALSAQALKRLFDDIHNRPIEDLVVTEGTVYGSRYYCVEPVGGNWVEMEAWCLDTYGDCGSIWDKDKAPEPNARWYMNDRRFWFRNEQDRTMFVLKWR
jgi:hypothetical protein